MRNIAHEILRAAGDSSSRIQPVESPAANWFVIPFETRMAFKPDSMVNIIDSLIRRNGLPADYIVNLSPAGEAGTIIFGYEVSGSTQTSIVPCLGREQPAMHYNLHIRFKENADQTSASSLLYIAAGCLSAAGLGLLFYNLFRRKKQKASQQNIQKDKTAINQPDFVIAVGNYLFYPEQQTLISGEEKIQLTQKETKLLGIFTAQLNEVIDRNRLQKEVWEDEGVIVGRSLDVFISRLRKKFEKDPAVKFTTVHGKGYKLEITA